MNVGDLVRWKTYVGEARMLGFEVPFECTDPKFQFEISGLLCELEEGYLIGDVALVLFPNGKLANVNPFFLEVTGDVETVSEVIGGD